MTNEEQTTTPGEDEITTPATPEAPATPQAETNEAPAQTAQQSA